MICLYNDKEGETMIFYFTGTGNSYDTALYFAKEQNDTLIDITKAMKQQEFHYHIKEEESIGFIFPVYFYGLPEIVAQFIKKLQFELAQIPYVYTVVTCGASTGSCAIQLNQLLIEKGIRVNASFSLVMGDNCVLFYDVTKQSELPTILKASEEARRQMLDIVQKKQNFHEPKDKTSLAQRILYKSYDFCKSTKKFHVTNDCMNCGLCEKICPVNAIEILNSQPHWVKSKCIKCTACINRCPKAAIQYGRLTKKRHRYVHPILATCKK